MTVEVNADELWKTATEILDAFWPVISIMGGLTIGLALINGITKSMKRIVGYDDQPLVAYSPLTIDEFNNALEEDEYEEEIQDIAPAREAVPVQCKECNGVTDIAGAVGRCKYCGTPLSVDGATRLTGHEPMIRKG